MNTVYILTGGNLGDRLANLQKAKEYLGNETGNIVLSSSIYETEAWGNTDQPDFYNQVHIINTKLSAEQMMEKILKIEEQMGRVRTVKNASRIIDIDILFFNNDVINKRDLAIPHPEISNRRFVLTPLNELSPELVHPVLNKSINEWLSTCKDTLSVRSLKAILPYQQIL
jgi:2-amino-4-hydroxy-6-hydroxymethyldihydropteridine diphosphokinase